VDHIKRITDEFGRQAQTFDVWAEKTDGQVADRFRAALGKAGQGNVLDVACGPGVVTAAIAPGAASVVAFDATEQMLEKARARCAKAGLRNVQFKRGDAESLSFDEAQFDGVVTRLTVHHFANPQRAFNEMLRVICPGGTAVIVDVVSSEDAMNKSAERNQRDPLTCECCLHRNWTHAWPVPVATFSTPLGTKAVNSKNGWESSMIPIVPNPSEQLSGRGRGQPHRRNGPVGQKRPGHILHRWPIEGDDEAH
jgi:ubiquinone/menaquinone biosynthesis C-methylase UbiE